MPRQTTEKLEKQYLGKYVRFTPESERKAASQNSSYSIKVTTLLIVGIETDMTLTQLYTALTCGESTVHIYNFSSKSVWHLRYPPTHDSKAMDIEGTIEVLDL